ncbi:MAG: VOC family protein [Hyphomonadaceae bacterium]
MTQAKVLSVAPVLCVSVMKPAIDFFVDRLGFTLTGSAGEPPSWASLERNGSEVMLACGNHPRPAQDWAAYFYVENVDALYAEVEQRGADIASGLVDKPHKCREFEARMPDGRLIAFGQSI